MGAKRAGNLRRALGAMVVVVLLLAAGLAAVPLLLARADTLAWIASRITASAGWVVRLDRVAPVSQRTLAIGHVHAAGGGWQIDIDDLRVRWASPWQMASEGRVDIESIGLRKLVVAGSGNAAADAAPPAGLALPVPVAVGHLRIDELAIGEGEAALRATALAGQWSFDGTRHRLRVERLQAAGLAFDLRGEIAAASPFELQGVVHARALAGQPHPTLIDRPLPDAAEAVLTIDGTLEHLRVRIQASLAAARLEGSALLHPFARPFAEQIRLRASDIDPQGLWPRLPQARLTLSIDGDLRADQRFAGRMMVRNALPGPLDQRRIPLVRLEATLEAGADDARLDVRTLDLGAGGLLAGRVQWRGGQIESDVRARGVDLSRLWSALHASQVAGEVRLVANAAGLDARGEFSDRDMRLRFDLERKAEQIRLRSFRFEGRGALAEGTARLDPGAARRFEVDAAVRHLDPSRLGRFPVASLSGHVVARGVLAGPEGPRVQASLHVHESRFRGLPLTGDAQLDWQARRRLATTTVLSLGATRLEAHGALGEVADRLAVRLVSPSLTPIGSGLAGSVNLVATLGGTLDEPDIDLALSGQGLSLPWQTRLASLEARARLVHDALHLDASVSGLDRAGVLIDAAHAEVDGSVVDHRVRFDGRTRGIDVALALRGALVGLPSGTWAGLVGAASQRADLRWQGTVLEFAERAGSGIVLLEPAPLAIAASTVDLGRATFEAAGGQVAIDALHVEPGALRSSGRFRQVEAGRLLAAAAVLGEGRSAAAAPATDRLVVEGDLRLGGDWQWQGDAVAPAGVLEAHRESGDLRLQGVPLGLERLRLRLALKASVLAATVDIRSRLGTVDAEAALPIEAGTQRAALRSDAPLRGRARFSLDGTLLATLMPTEGLQLGGHADGNVDLQGSLASPALVGQVRGRDLLIEVPSEGVSLRKGRFDLQFDEREARLVRARLEGESGYLEATGRMNWADGRLAASLGADAVGLTLVNGPELRMVVTGRLDVDAQEGQITVKGRMRADEGDLSLRPARLRVSSDVVVRGKTVAPGRAATGGAGGAPSLNLELDFGDRFRVRGFGASARLTGVAQLTRAEAGALRLLGRVGIVEGIVNAYGQSLRVDQGSVTFNGPVDNPVLDITALRPNIPIKAGVQLSGFARTPRLRLFSDPPLPDSQVLAWVALGRSAEGLAVSDWQFIAEMAAASLAGTTEGTPLSTRIARVAGLDELQVRSSAGSSPVPLAGSGARPGVGETVVALGKRLSDRLTVTVERSLTGVGTVLRGRYQLTPRWLVQAETGIRQTVDLFFSIAFNRWFERPPVATVLPLSPLSPVSPSGATTAGPPAGG